MDWSNEPYVRIYKRDTTNWRLLGWKGQATLVLLLRKVDRSGALELDGIEPWEAVSLATGLPEEVTREGVAKLLERETLKVVGGLLVAPKHIEAQEAVKSDRLRARESRERRALGVVADGVTTHHAESRAVTKRDAGLTVRDDTSRAVTPQPDESRAVTPRHSLQCSAVQNSAVLVPHERAHADVMQPSATDLREALVSQATSLVRREFARRFEQVEGSLWTQAGDPAVDELGRWLASLRGDMGANCARVLDVFFADPWCRSQHFPVRHLARQPQKYFEPRQAPAPAAKVDRSERLAELNSELSVLDGDLACARADGDLERAAELIERKDELIAELRKLKGAT